MVTLVNARPAPAIMDRVRVVSVNGTVIARAAIAREMQNHGAGKAGDAWLQAARALVIRELLLQEACRIGLEAVPETDAQDRRETEEEALVRMLVARDVVTPQPTDAECRRYFETNRRHFKSPALYEVRHILLAADPGDETKRSAQRELAQVIIGELTKAPARFGDLAAAHSACPSGKVGGSLGQIGPGQTVAEFEAALATLPLGEVSPEPIATRYGYHIVVVDRRIEGIELPFELVKDGIAEWLSERVRRTAIRQYISLLAGRARIEGITLQAADTPLLQ